jgi:hypothetical protein
MVPFSVLMTLERVVTFRVAFALFAHAKPVPQLHGESPAYPLWPRYLQEQLNLPVSCPILPARDSLSLTQSIGFTVPFGILEAWNLLNMYIEIPPRLLSAPFPFFASYLPARKARCIHRR